jgi:hypothetical protein
MPKPLHVPPVAAFVFLLAWVGCGPADEGESGSGVVPEPPVTAAPGEAGAPEAGGWMGDVQVGRRVDAEGAIPPAQQGEAFTPGETVYVSMAISDAPADASVHVVFENRAGEKVAEDAKKVPAEARYLYFDSGDTAHWTPGGYRVVIAVDGQVISTEELTMSDRPVAPQGEPG